MPETKSENNVLLGIMLVLIVLSSYLMLGLAGARTVLGMMIVVFLPFYLIFNNFNLSQAEKITFSFFVSIAIYPSLAYWLGFIVPFRISVLAVFILLIILSFALKKFRKKSSPSG